MILEIEVIRLWLESSKNMNYENKINEELS